MSTSTSNFQFNLSSVANSVNPGSSVIYTGSSNPPSPPFEIDLTLNHNPDVKNYSQDFSAFGLKWNVLFRISDKHSHGGVFLNCKDATKSNLPTFKKWIKFLIQIYKTNSEEILYTLEKSYQFEHTEKNMPMKNDHGSYTFLSKEDFKAGRGFVDPATNQFHIKVIMDENKEGGGTIGISNSVSFGNSFMAVGDERIEHPNLSETSPSSFSTSQMGSAAIDRYAEDKDEVIHTDKELDHK